MVKVADTPMIGTGEPVTLAQAVTAALVGLLVAPALLGPAEPGSTYTAGGLDPRLALWLAAACLIAVWLLVLAPAMGRAATRLLARALPDDPSPLDARSGLRPALARWLVALGYAVLTSAIARAPLVGVLSSFLDPLAVESAVAGVVLLLLILVLVRLHRAAAPAVEVYTWHALDALVSTSGPLPAGQSESMLRTRSYGTARSETRRVATPSAATAPLPATVPPSATVPPDGGATEGSVGRSGPTLAEAVGMTAPDLAQKVAEAPARTAAGLATEVTGAESSGEDKTRPEDAATQPPLESAADEPQARPAAA